MISPASLKFRKLIPLTTLMSIIAVIKPATATTQVVIVIILGTLLP